MPKYVTCQNKIKSIGPQILWLAQFMYCARFLDFTARYCHCELSLKNEIVASKVRHLHVHSVRCPLDLELDFRHLSEPCRCPAGAWPEQSSGSNIWQPLLPPGFSDQRRILARRAAPRHSLVRHQHLHRLCQQADRVSRLHYLSCHRKLSSQPQGP